MSTSTGQLHKQYIIRTPNDGIFYGYFTGAIKVTDIMTCGGYRLVSCHVLDYRLIHTIFCIDLEGFRIVFSH